MPLGGQEEMLSLVSRRMGGLFSVPATQPSRHAVLLSVMSCEGKLWADRGKEEQLPVQGD